MNVTTIKNMSNQTKGILCCLMGILILTPDPLCLRFLGPIDIATLIFYKYIIFLGTFLTVYLFIERTNAWNEFKAIGWIGFIAGIVWGISSISITYAFVKTAVANVVVINAANPMFSAIYSMIILSEKVPLRTIIASVVSFGAIVLIFYSQLGQGGSEDNTIGLIASLITANTQGLFFVLIRYAVLQG